MMRASFVQPAILAAFWQRPLFFFFSTYLVIMFSALTFSLVQQEGLSTTWISSRNSLFSWICACGCILASPCLVLFHNGLYEAFRICPLPVTFCWYVFFFHVFNPPGAKIGHPGRPDLKRPDWNSAYSSSVSIRIKPRNSQQVAKYAEPRYHDILRYNGLEK